LVQGLVELFEGDLRYVRTFTREGGWLSVLY